jgi:hypothetical protein
MHKPEQRLLPDDETRELLRVAKRLSRRMGVPVKVLVPSIAKLIVAEQLRAEALDESIAKSAHDDGNSPA